MSHTHNFRFGGWNEKKIGNSNDFERIVSEPRTAMKQFAGLLSNGSSEESLDDEDLGAIRRIKGRKYTSSAEQPALSPHALFRKLKAKNQVGKLNEEDDQAKSTVAESITLASPNELITKIQRDSVEIAKPLLVSDYKGKSPSINKVLLNDDSMISTVKNNSLAFIGSTSLMGPKATDILSPMNTVAVKLRPDFVRLEMANQKSIASSQSSLSIDSVDYDYHVESAKSSLEAVPITGNNLEVIGDEFQQLFNVPVKKEKSIKLQESLSIKSTENLPCSTAKYKYPVTSTIAKESPSVHTFKERELYIDGTDVMIDQSVDMMKKESQSLFVDFQNQEPEERTPTKGEFQFDILGVALDIPEQSDRSQISLAFRIPTQNKSSDTLKYKYPVVTSRNHLVYEEMPLMILKNDVSLDSVFDDNQVPVIVTKQGDTKCSTVAAPDLMKILVSETKEIENVPLMHEIGPRNEESLQGQQKLNKSAEILSTSLKFVYPISITKDNCISTTSKMEISLDSLIDVLEQPSNDDDQCFSVDKKHDPVDAEAELSIADVRKEDNLLENAPISIEDRVNNTDLPILKFMRLNKFSDTLSTYPISTSKKSIAEVDNEENLSLFDEQAPISINSDEKVFTHPANIEVSLHQFKDDAQAIENVVEKERLMQQSLQIVKFSKSSKFLNASTDKYKYPLLSSNLNLAVEMTERFEEIQASLDSLNDEQAPTSMICQKSFIEIESEFYHLEIAVNNKYDIKEDTLATQENHIIPVDSDNILKLLNSLQVPSGELLCTSRGDIETSILPAKGMDKSEDIELPEMRFMRLNKSLEYLISTDKYKYGPSSSKCNLLNAESLLDSQQLSLDSLSDGILENDNIAETEMDRSTSYTHAIDNELVEDSLNIKPASLNFKQNQSENQNLHEYTVLKDFEDVDCILVTEFLPFRESVVSKNRLLNVALQPAQPAQDIESDSLANLIQITPTTLITNYTGKEIDATINEQGHNQDDTYSSSLHTVKSKLQRELFEIRVIDENDRLRKELESQRKVGSTLMLENLALRNGITLSEAKDKNLKMAQSDASQILQYHRFEKRTSQRLIEELLRLNTAAIADLKNTVKERDEHIFALNDIIDGLKKKAREAENIKRFIDDKLPYLFERSFLESPTTSELGDEKQKNATLQKTSKLLSFNASENIEEKIEEFLLDQSAQKTLHESVVALKISDLEKESLDICCHGVRTMHLQEVAMMDAAKLKIASLEKELTEKEQHNSKENAAIHQQMGQQSALLEGCHSELDAAKLKIASLEKELTEKEQHNSKENAAVPLQESQKNYLLQIEELKNMSKVSSVELEEMQKKLISREKIEATLSATIFEEKQKQSLLASRLDGIAKSFSLKVDDSIEEKIGLFLLQFNNSKELVNDLNHKEDAFKKEKGYLMSRILELKQELVDAALNTEDQILSKDIEINALKEDLSVKESAILNAEQMLTRIPHLEAKLYETQNILKESENHADQLKLRLNDEIQAKILELEKMRNERSAEAYLHEKNTNSLKQAAAKHTIEFKSNLVLVDNTNRKLDDMKQAIDVKAQEITKLTSISKNEKYSFEKKESDLNAELLKLQEELKAVSRNQAGALAKIKFAHDTELADAEGRTADIKEELRKSNLAGADMRRQVEKLEKERLGLEQNLCYLIKSPSETTNLLECQKNQIRDLELQISKSDLETKEQHKELVKLNKQIADLDCQVHSLQKDNNDSKNSLKKSEQTVDDLKSKLLDSKRSIRQLKEVHDLKEQTIIEDKQRLLQQNQILKGELDKLKVDNLNDTELQSLRNENWDLSAKLDYSGILMAEVMIEFKDRLRFLRTINSMRLRKKYRGHTSRIPILKVAWYESSHMAIPLQHEKMSPVEVDYYASLLTQKDIAIRELRYNLLEARQKIRLKTSLMKSLLASNDDLEARILNRSSIDQKLTQIDEKLNSAHRLQSRIESLQSNGFCSTEFDDYDEKVENPVGSLYMKFEESEKKTLQLQRAIVTRDALVKEQCKVTKHANSSNCTIQPKLISIDQNYVDNEPPLISESVDLNLLAELSSTRAERQSALMEVSELKSSVQLYETAISIKDIEILELSQKLDLLSHLLANLQKENATSATELNNTDVVLKDWIQLSKQVEEKEKSISKERENITAIFNFLADISNYAPGLTESCKMVIDNFRDEWLKKGLENENSKPVSVKAENLVHPLENLKLNFIIENMKVKLQMSESDRYRILLEFQTFQEEQKNICRDYLKEIEVNRARVKELESEIPKIINDIMDRYQKEHLQTQKLQSMLLEMQQSASYNNLLFSTSIQHDLVEIIEHVKESETLLYQNSATSSAKLEQITNSTQSLLEPSGKSLEKAKSLIIAPRSRKGSLIPVSPNMVPSRSRSKSLLTVPGPVHTVKASSLVAKPLAASIIEQHPTEMKHRLLLICNNLKISVSQSESEVEMINLIVVEIENLNESLQKCNLEVNQLKRKNKKAEEELFQKIEDLENIKSENQQLKERTADDLKQSPEFISLKEALDSSQIQFVEQEKRLVLQKNELIATQEAMEQCQIMLAKLSKELSKIEALEEKNMRLKEQIDQRERDNNERLLASQNESSLDPSHSIPHLPMFNGNFPNDHRLFYRSEQHTKLENSLKHESEEFHALNLKFAQSQAIQDDLIKKIHWIAGKLPQGITSALKLNSVLMNSQNNVAKESKAESSTGSDESDVEDQIMRRNERIQRLKKLMNANVEIRRQQKK